METIFKRKIYQELLTWKDSLKQKKKALIIQGTRQIGKTRIVNLFAENEYENKVYINFVDDLDAKKSFDNNLNVDQIVASLSTKIPNAKFVPYKTVIIFDEIQNCPRARTAIKAFMLDERYDIICTGSLLGISGYSKDNNASIPVGFEHHLTMHAMDFEEFLWANGYEPVVIDQIKDHFINLKKVPDDINEVFNRLFKYYICVGGMPEAVEKFIETKDLNQVRNVQRDILKSKEDDFGKHLDNQGKTIINNVELNRIRQVFYSIPTQIARTNNKFKLDLVAKGARLREYQTSIQWLWDAGIIELAYNINNLEYPIEGYKIDNYFKTYMYDTGLFISMFDNAMANAIINNDIKTYKGYIYENIVADALVKNNIKLFFYHKNTLEIDFMLPFNMQVCPLEVKATNGNAKSLKLMMNHEKHKSNILFGIKLESGNLGFTNNILTIPHYMVFLLNETYMSPLIKKIQSIKSH